MTRGEDRRVRRTRSALQTALLELVVKRAYETITVADICDAADVGRSAFYQHFKGKDDLLRAGFAKLEDDLGRGEAGQDASFSNAFLEHAIQHRVLYRALMRSQAAPIVSAAIRRILVEKASNLITAESGTGVPRELRATLLADLLLSLTLWWFDRDARLPVCDVEAMFAEMATGILGEQGGRYASPGQTK
ncbi:TetR/AcrR family transcriptional regulator [Parasedimentitalea huanghaiensis]|uniref:TetR family transcriptional regulator n=1 Tax=Parasedimentitalea huanghaiensis TaxID=2682100 RepID=A0A6L6WKU9_9RHOB|nr:TetR/AcrR family transcriptional regulator [Zongyanglinia huanghaiensis]MVO17619.1 TetR family transcriptional regulator [Zongyanglinia huanghaiensis]